MSGSAGAVIPFSGTYWNASGTDYNTHPLLTSTQAESGLFLRMSSAPRSGVQDGDALFRDSVIGDATISGLIPQHDYQIVIYSAANTQGIFRVNQPFDTLSPAYGEVSCTYEHTVLPGVEGCDYVVGTATADAFGEISVRVSPGAMAGMQLATNPEPSTGMLSLIAGLGLALRRRRD